MDYLALCQRYTFEVGDSGESGAVPAAVTAQTGKLLQSVYNVNQAYTFLQEMQKDWNWRNAEATGVETVAANVRTVTLLGASSDFDELRPYFTDSGQPYILMYLSATGTTDQQNLYLLPWQEFTGYYDSSRFTSPGRPKYASVAPDKTLKLWPETDAIYKLKYRYRKTIQALAANADTPTLPAKYHMLIVYLAMTLYGGSNESNRVREWLGNGPDDRSVPNSPLAQLYRALCNEELRDPIFNGGF